MEQIWLHKRPRNGSKWSSEYHIYYYTSKCSSWSVVFKSSDCHLGKPGITQYSRWRPRRPPVIEMSPGTRMHALLSTYEYYLGFEFTKHCQNDNRVRIVKDIIGYCYNIPIKKAATTFPRVAVQFHTFVYNNKCFICRLWWYLSMSMNYISTE